MTTSASQLYKKISTYDSFVSKEDIQKAYNFSKKAHSNQFRSSGEEYFTHPLAVANYLTEMKLDASSIMTALLHDVVEDCESSSQDLYAYAALLDGAGPYGDGSDTSVNL